MSDPGLDFSRLLLNRELPRCMYPGEFIETLWEHKHPRVQSLGVESSRWGAQAREDLGIPAAGTLWVAARERLEKSPSVIATGDLKFEVTETIGTTKSTICVVPQNCLPYLSRRDAEFDEKQRRFVGDLARGWRNALSVLTAQGILYPSRELSWLIGEDTFKLCPRRYWE